MTDITGGIISYQLLGQCAKQEMELMDCMEAYGLDRGLKKCKKLVEDYRECHTKVKQFRRFYVSRIHEFGSISYSLLKTVND